jgi:selenocysteine lyase/cysteine desulfurase
LSHYPIEQIRQDYRALHEVCYLNTGTVGIMSETVLNPHLERIARYERYGHFAESEARNGYQRSRELLANLINATSEEVALTRNASDGVNYVLHGLDVPSKSTLLTTDQEHPAVLLPMTLATRSTGNSIKMLELDSSDDRLLSQLASFLDEGNVYLAVISHVSCETGRRLPIAEMCRLCREYGVLTLVDGAQSIGQFPVDVRDIGCDYMTGNGHKWLCGPKGTGFLYVRLDRIETLTPPYAGDGSVDPRFDRTSFLKDNITDEWVFRSDAERFEFGTRNWHLFGAIADSITQIEQIGWNAIQSHVSDVSTYAKSALGSRAGVTVHTPVSWEDSCGIVTFSLDGADGVTLSDRLWNEKDIIQRRVQMPSGVRVSCAHYTNQDDIDQFLIALDEIRRS